MGSRRALLTAALLSALPVAVSAQVVVVPNAQATSEGNANTTLPFSCTGFSASMRHQQVYLGSEVGFSGNVVEIRFRQDIIGTSFGPTTFPGVTMTLSTTAAGPDALSATFSANVGSDVTTVFSGNLVLSSAASTAVPRPFDIVIPLTTPFPFNPAAGNLLLDVTIPTCQSTTPFDMQNVPLDSVSRVFAGSAGAATGLVFSEGLVTQFTITQAVPTLPEWTRAGLALLLTGVAAWQLRRRRARVGTG